VFVLRYNANGTLDTTFDGDGKVVIDAVSVRGEAQAVAIQADGRIVVAGKELVATPGGNVGMGRLVRLNGNGAFDASFGVGGEVISDRFYYLTDLAVQADGNSTPSVPGRVCGRCRPFPDEWQSRPASRRRGRERHSRRHRIARYCWIVDGSSAEPGDHNSGRIVIGGSSSDLTCSI
jgi:uncharacterized delta-60 repeat protein